MFGFDFLMKKNGGSQPASQHDELCVTDCDKGWIFEGFIAEKAAVLLKEMNKLDMGLK